MILRASEEARVAKVKSVSNEAQDDEEAARLQEIGRLVSGKRARTEMESIPANKKANTKGPLDLMFFQKPEATVGKGKQTSIKDTDKEARERANQYIARFFYLNGIAFNVAKSKSFKLMVEAKGRTLINFLINSPSGTMFIKSIDASSQVKTGKAMLDEFVKEIGKSRVVQLVTDNGANYVLAGKVSTCETENLLDSMCCTLHRFNARRDWKDSKSKEGCNTRN